MKPIELVVRCYANKDGDQWQIFCIDLCLAAQAETLNEAHKKMQVMIAHYVNDALTIDRDYADQLLSRKAPIKQRMTYFYYKLLHKIGRLKNDLHTLFKEVIPLVPQNFAH